MNPVLRSSAAHLVIDDIENPVLSDSDLHHLFRVLRLRDGEVMTVTDGRGSWRALRVAGGDVRPDGEIVRTTMDAPCVVAAAIPKGDRLDWMVQKCTEVGVTRLVLLDTARGVVRWDGDRAARQIERARKIAREAAQQSRRIVMPSVEGPTPFSEVVAAPGAVLADPDGLPVGGGLRLRAGGPVIIGPEGGFDRAELALADSLGVARVAFAQGVLRVETAAVVAAALIAAHSIDGE